MTRMTKRPKGWIKVKRVRVVRNKGRLVVEYEKAPPKRKAKKRKSNPSRKRKTTRPKARRTKKRAQSRTKKGKR